MTSRDDEDWNDWRYKFYNLNYCNAKLFLLNLLFTRKLKKVRDQNT